VIDEIIQFAVQNGAATSNVAPSNFNPVPADGFLEVWACLDALPAHGGVLNGAPTLSVTLGGATPYTPVPSAAIRVNVDGIAGAGPSESDRVMSRQGVRQGTNFQLNLTGGTQASGTTDTITGRIRVRFVSADEVAAGAGAVAA
jgi:hypothetical protein